MNEVWAILPLAELVHDRVPADRKLKELCDWIMTQRATQEQLRPYCKAIDYIKLKRRLQTKYGRYHCGMIFAQPIA